MRTRLIHVAFSNCIYLFNNSNKPSLKNNILFGFVLNDLRFNFVHESILNTIIILF